MQWGQCAAVLARSGTSSPGAAVLLHQGQRLSLRLPCRNKCAGHRNVSVWLVVWLFFSIKNQFQVCKPLQERRMPGMLLAAPRAVGRGGSGAWPGGAPCGGGLLLAGRKGAGEPRGALAQSRRCCGLGTGSLRRLSRPEPCPSRGVLQPRSPPGAAAGTASGCHTRRESVGTGEKPSCSWPSASLAARDSPGSRGASAQAFPGHERRVPRESRERQQFALTGLLSGLRQSRAYRAGSLGEGGRAAPGASRERWLIPAVSGGGGCRPGQPVLAGSGAGTGSAAVVLCLSGEAAQPPLLSPRAAPAQGPGRGEPMPGARGPLLPPGSHRCSRDPAPAIPGEQRELDESKRQN